MNRFFSFFIFVFSTFFVSREKGNGKVFNVNAFCLRSRMVRERERLIQEEEKQTIKQKM